MSRSVTKFGARLATGLAITGLAGAALLTTFDHAEARSKKRAPRIVHAAAGATFTGASNYAALVVDAKTGRTLYEKNADAIRFPASVTKVMTLYLVFEDLERGRVRLDTRMTMSSECASRAPSKLGLRPGQTIDVEDGIKALVTKSANDVACAFGDNLEGSESAFAERMTRKARAIGMSSSVFRNASGLPNGSHVTTARDLVTLGRAIQDRFPRYYGYFGTRVFNFAGRSIGNHNKLLGRVEGVDGIKTGYTNASGFNLLSSVKSNGRSIVAVVMGGRSGPSRDNHMRELIALNLPKAQPGARTAPLVADASAREPAAVRGARPAVMASVPTPIASPLPGAQRVASLETVPTPPPAPVPAPIASGATPKPEARIVEARVRTVSAESEPVEAASLAPAPQPMRWVVGATPTTTGSVAAEAEPRTQLASAAGPVSARSPRSGARDVVEASAPVVEQQPVRKGWMIQIGATTEPSQAQALLSDAKTKGGRALNAAEPFTETFTKGATTYYRARFAGLNEQSADAACKALKRSSVSCFAIKN
ncbi:SPOR domain-containing protein [Chenggangzhangella methanolivorans]|uniref:SPOR domain-containing protein n=1 Tax=Chenggangzhangella methanolivorans TaxID=1437009 RepID=A0A9E6RE21_9HYPH|nr:SPOR domain-containing protein [Chenggangzhangella methanolivorans]QZN99435.1 SPOR domain-containing protein [Chenggangzhangella methanolivorans]